MISSWKRTDYLRKIRAGSTVAEDVYKDQIRWARDVGYTKDGKLTDEGSAALEAYIHKASGNAYVRGVDGRRIRVHRTFNRRKPLDGHAE